MNYVKLHVEIPFNEMPEILNICDICVSHFNFHKKWPHNCSIKHMEYMASGKPVVATDVGEVNFAIENDINGFLCREGKVLDYVNAIDRLANNPNLRKKFGNAGRLKSETTLTWKSNLEKILFFFKKQN
jgi:glycosyltransferase involved in cell wall biosynthesis